MRHTTTGMIKLAALGLLLPLAVFGAVACSKGVDPPAQAPAAGASTDGSARTLPIPGQGQPPIDGSGAQAMPVKWKVPDGWTAETPENSVRLAQYRVSGSGGDGECVVFYFGPGQGGDALANAQRWAGQFAQPDGSSSEDKLKVSTLSTGQVPLQLVEVTGTYDGGMSAAGTSEGYMLLGGIAEGPDAPWFFKFTGPEATVREQRAAFVSLLESVTVDG